MRTPCLLLLAALLLGLTGCGGGSKSDASGPADKDKVEDIARLVKDFTERHKRPPAGLREVRDADATHPVAYAALVSKEYVLFWQAAISPGAAGTVLAYHKDVPTKGGTVLMQDGKVRAMTVEEFRAAPKAGR